jgi:prepilin-type N-terminal cleavage/methylation domain-containing protein
MSREFTVTVGLRHGARPATSRQAFTLLELLVAMAVLGMVMAVLLQLSDSLLNSIAAQTRQMDSVAAARRALDVMAADLQSAKIDNSSSILVPAAPGDDLLALLAGRRGSNGTTDHRFLAVRYSTNGGGALVRSYGSVGYAGQDMLQATLDASVPDASSPTSLYPLASGILGIEIRALGDGSNSYAFGLGAAEAHWATNNYNGQPVPAGYLALVTRAPSFAHGLTNRTRAIEVWIAAVNDQNYEFLESVNKLTAVKAALGPWPPAWRAGIDNSPDLPPRAKSAIRILTKTIPLP